MSLASSTIKTNKKKKDIVGQIKFFFSFLTEGLHFALFVLMSADAYVAFSILHPCLQACKRK